MDALAQTVAAAIGMFAGTNIDDIVVLTTLFLAGRTTGRPRWWEIVGGQYLGFLTLVGVSVAAAAGLTAIPDPWVGLLGLIPLALGVRGLLAARRANPDSDRPAPIAAGLPAIAGVTIANGADNLSVYTPLFRTIGITASVVTIVVFLALLAGWCAAGALLGNHKVVIGWLERAGRWLVPAVFIAIGAVILVESGALGRLAAAG